MDGRGFGGDCGLFMTNILQTIGRIRKAEGSIYTSTKHNPKEKHIKDSPQKNSRI